MISSPVADPVWEKIQRKRDCLEMALRAGVGSQTEALARDFYSYLYGELNGK